MKTIKILLVIFILLLSGCQKKELHPDPIDDNYRVFYEIFVGSFSDSNNDGIGDLRGIINRLDYLNDGDINSNESLGIQGIWLTPIFKSPSYHKYDAIDYYTIDPQFGTIDDLIELIRECHERNILLILDLAINHTSSQSEWFKEFQRAHQKNDKQNKYYDYYVYKQKGENIKNKTFCELLNTNEEYECNFSYDMPELNFDNEEVRKEVLQVAEYYLNLGIDGFRFDAAKYIYHSDNPNSTDFWDWYTGEIRKIKKDVYLVSEVWSGENEINQYVKDMNCFNFAMSGAEGRIALAAKGNNINNYTSYVSAYQNRLKNINPEAMPISFISNHDMDRCSGYLNIMNNQAYMASNLYLLSPGSPFIYYGEEIGMKGTRGNSNTDANRRLGMLWGDGDSISNPEGSDFNDNKQVNGTVKDQLENEKSLLNHYKKLISFRNSYPFIARGTYEQVNLNNENVGGFKITYNNEIHYLIHNNSTKTVTLNELEYKELIDYIGIDKAIYNNGQLVIGPYTSIIIK